MRLKCLCVLVFCFVASFCLAEETPQVSLPERASFQLYLLAGQSNMAGRGKVEDQDKVPNPRVLTFTKENKWVPAVDPIHFDKAAAGVCLGRTFGLSMAEKNDKVTIGLIPCAVGGSPISTWKPTEEWTQTKTHPYDDAIKRAHLAMKDGVLKGILWHQGESDTKPENAAKYKENLTDLIARLRKELDAPEVPFIIGQLGRFPQTPWSEGKKNVNDAQESVAKEVKFCGFVSSENLTQLPQSASLSA